MKASELRIGNWIRGESDHKKRHVQAGLNEIYYSSLFEPIPLTEERLLKFGLEKDGPNYIIGSIVIRQEKTRSGITSNWKIYFNGIRIKKDLKHVHQFQNLYFALTGEELQYNSPKK